ncbi:solute carrier family 25 member 35 isoform X3 [Polyodon spathula]|uniref:solute carrier family 25 member 35 isoform X3 n=1 Tax=Polyodon spathula TaxID=7913 RepID=UPI001B7DE201|nr:solute carrier family 25 member 35 isoform X3 [Polyodon spathula]
MDFVLSGAAACGACLFTNPLEVVKTRMQLQGELKAPGSYQVHYRNVFHAFYTIGRVDGLAGLQKGLVPGLLYQFCMNGFRLGSFAIIESAGYIHSEDGRVIPGKSIAAGAIAGVIGAVMGSPVYLIFPSESWLVALTAGMVSSVVVVVAMTPFDVVSTRLYNQPVDSRGQGLLYRGFVDCFMKTVRKESMLGLYKGIGASYFRLGPHTILSLLFWNELRKFYCQHRLHS